MEKRVRPRSQKRSARGNPYARFPHKRGDSLIKINPGHSYFHKLSAHDLSTSGRIGALKASAFSRVSVPNGRYLEGVKFFSIFQRRGVSAEKLAAGRATSNELSNEHYIYISRLYHRTRSAWERRASEISGYKLENEWPYAKSLSKGHVKRAPALLWINTYDSMFLRGSLP